VHRAFGFFSFSVRILIFSYFLFADLIPFGIYFPVISNRCLFVSGNIQSFFALSFIFPVISH